MGQICILGKLLTQCNLKVVYIFTNFSGVNERTTCISKKNKQKSMNYLFKNGLILSKNALIK